MRLVRVKRSLPADEFKMIPSPSKFIDNVSIETSMTYEGRLTKLIIKGGFTV